LQYRQLEYYRMPLMAFLALQNPDELTRADYVRLALANGAGNRSQLPFTERHLADFENKYCYDRYHEKRAANDWPGTRFMSCGHSFVVTGDAGNAFFVDAEQGFLNAFRHQHFLLFLIAHFHKAALLMFSDRLAEAVNRLDVGDPQAVQDFRASTRHALETFLRFTHRYWFHAVSNQDQARDLFVLCRRHLGLDELYEDIRQEVQEMSQYLENEATRRQNDSIVRLTVVTAFGLIGTVATGFLGMNLFDHTTFDPLTKLAIFLAVFVPTMLLTFYTIAKSQRLFEFLDAIASENKSLGAKLRSFRNVWTRRPAPMQFPDSDQSSAAFLGRQRRRG
jgi:CorA-like Mg2+ transporter protein